MTQTKIKTPRISNKKLNIEKIPKKAEKDGIIYFDTPYKVNGLSFAHKHLDCDAIIIKEPTYSKEMRVVCYASNESYNKALNNLFLSHYKGNGYKLLVGISSKEMNCID